MSYLIYLLSFVLGLVIGSFVTVLTYRLVRKVTIIKGRSFCPKCKQKIVWFDNIPLLSFLLLKGRCRNCKKRISLRYPLIEITTALGFVGIWMIYNSCFFPGSSQKMFLLETNESAFCNWTSTLGFWVTPFFFVIFFFLLSIFIIDLEEKVIPDVLVFIPLIIVSVALVLFWEEGFFLHLLSGFLAASFLLFLHLITKGKGMGLGDVKFALFGGALVGFPSVVSWLFLSFLTGACVGIILIIGKKAKLRQKIAFGPFLVLALVIEIAFGPILLKIIGL